MSAHASLIAGSSEMSVLIRTFDWTQTPLGPIENWPAELIGAVNLVVSWPSPMTIYWGPAFLLIYNDAYKQFLSDKHPHSLGAPAATIWQEMWSLIEPDFQSALVTGTPVIQKDVYLPILHAGLLRDEWWNYTLSPLFQGDRIAGLLNAAENRTEAVLAQRDLLSVQAARERVADALASSEQRLQIALETAQLGIWQLDLDSRTLEGSPTFKAQFGRRPGDPFTYEDLLASVHSEDLTRWQDDMEQATAKSLAYRNEYRIRWPDQTEHWVLASVTTLPGGEQSRGMLIGVLLDVTERHRTTAALIQTEKLAAVGRLASSIAHEINNPLEAVTNLIYLANSVAVSSETRHYLDVAERELRRVGGIAKQTLRFHKQATSASSCSCVDLIANALMIYEGRLVNSGIAVHKRKRAETPVVCFESEISQVLSNLISNAIDAMHGQGGKLFLRSREGRNWQTGQQGLVITVADTGPGMSRVTRERLFEAFYTTKGIGGTGLGLWISQSLVESHNGRLRFRSSQDPQHHGTVFSLFLPYLSQAQPSA